MVRIQPIDIVAPGSRGLNTEGASKLLDPRWCTIALNAVVNRTGRIAARKGWVKQTATPIAGLPSIDVLHEYIQEDGTSTFISAAANKIYKNISDYTSAANDITSSTAPTDDNWQFIDFNDYVLGFQTGHAPIEWDGTSDFVDTTFSGTGPDGNCACAAFGRVWALDADLQTIRVSVLNDHTDYSDTNGGTTIDMSQVWTSGMDQVVAISAVGANLVVFGKRHVVMWADGSGSQIGMTPETMEIVDIIEGTGCIARDSVAITGGGDLLYLAREGVQSLQRVIMQKSNPLTAISKHIRSELLETIAQQESDDSSLERVRAAHNARDGLYVINFPDAGFMYAFDTHHPFQDDDGEVVYPITKWDMSGDLVAVMASRAGSLYFGGSGVVGIYSGYSDNGTPYTLRMWTGWLDFGELSHYLKMLKEIVGTVEVGTTAVVTWLWEFDFSGVELTRQVSYTGPPVYEFSIAEFSLAEFSGGIMLVRRTLPAHGEGQFLKLGMEAPIQGSEIVLQQLSVAPKIGRMVT